MSSLFALTTTNFDEELGSVTPVRAERGAEHQAKLRVGKVDITAEAALAERCGVRSIPHRMLFERGEVLAKVADARGRQGSLDAVLPLL